MKGSILLLIAATAAMAQITISEAQMKKMGITAGSVSITSSVTVGPLIAKIDYDEEKSKSYFLDHEASVITLNVRPGDRVKKGQILCRIASPELLANGFELKEVRNRYQSIQNNAKKDEALYKEGIISYRDYQISALEAASFDLVFRRSKRSLPSQGFVQARTALWQLSHKKMGLSLPLHWLWLKKSPLTSLIFGFRIRMRW